MITRAGEEAVSLRTEYETSDPFELMRLLRINLLWKNNLKDLKGFYKEFLEEQYIVINSNLEETETRIVAAHELGHAVLHREWAESLACDTALYDDTNRTEYEANVFAAELLIPDGDVFAALEDSPDFYEISRTLGYPPPLVAFKLREMKRRGLALRLPEIPDSRFLRDPLNAGK